MVLVRQAAVYYQCKVWVMVLWCICVCYRPCRDGTSASGRGVLSMQGLSHGVVRVISGSNLTSLTLQDCGQVLPGGHTLHSVCLSVCLSINQSQGCKLSRFSRKLHKFEAHFTCARFCYKTSISVCQTFCHTIWVTVLWCIFVCCLLTYHEFKCV